MKPFLATILLLCCTLLRAQFAYYQTMPSSYALINKIVKQTGVKQYEKTTYNKKGKTKNVTVYQLNTIGNIQAVYQYDKHKNLTSQIKYTYWRDSLTESYLSCKANGDTLNYYCYQYNNQGKQIQLRSRTKKSTAVYDYRYDSDNRLIETVLSMNGHQKWRYTYEYDETGKRTKSMYYNANNKLKRQTTYLCDYRGTSEQPKAVATSNICKRSTALPDGGYAVYQDFTDNKMRLSRTVYTYNADSNMVKWETFNHQNRLILKNEYTYDQTGNCTLSTIFNKDNKVFYTMQSTYNDKKLPISIVTGKPGKVFKSETFSYQF